jgi:hypothetical protein
VGSACGSLAFSVSGSTNNRPSLAGGYQGIRSMLPSDTNLNPTAGHLLAGIEVNPYQFLARVQMTQLAQIAPNPEDTEDRKMRDANRDLQKTYGLREEIQRAFQGSKARNVISYCDYLVGLHSGNEGIAPPIILYSVDRLPVGVGSDGSGYIQIPWDVKLVAIDGETQLAARYRAMQQNPETKADYVAVYVCHGRAVSWAQQSFHDLNVLAVRPNAAVGIGMDNRDNITKVARYVERSVPALSNRISHNKRQLGSLDSEIMTITTLRGGCATLAEGISGIKYGARAVPIDEAIVPMLAAIAIEWFGALSTSFGRTFTDRKDSLVAAPPIFAALGAYGHPLIKLSDRSARVIEITRLIGDLMTVDWSKGKHWEGIAGKFTPSGRFSVGGTKETAYAVFNALSNLTSPAYGVIRRAAVVNLLADSRAPVSEPALT